MADKRGAYSAGLYGVTLHKIALVEWVLPKSCIPYQALYFSRKKQVITSDVTSQWKMVCSSCAACPVPDSVLVSCELIWT